ncbi:unnamed protein product [Acanthoscelides obtectus]|uniref:RNase H type-1 domain-containing protein n=1 Tax=Acanthoscelides obtectus TaxID=200917 RepID=A0A9P0M4H1_ACAOB|nr:unnamed protein product [Acanthoscelides obtectus]CAK1656962.1 hypothetical protein AOBTE_LOCUS20047 [Acanthoscelides obtectus]
MAANNMSFSDAKSSVEHSYANVTTNNRYEILDSALAENFPALPQRNQNIRNSSQPSQRYHQMYPLPTLGFNKKRKVQSSPVNNAAPMFSFNVGPSTSILSSQSYQSNVSDKDEIIEKLSTLLYQLINSAQNFDEPKKLRYNIVRKDREDGRAGVAIVIKRGLPYQEIDLRIANPNIMVCGLSITKHNLDLSIFSIYTPPNIRSSSSDWEEIISYSRSSTLLGGDLNAHSQSWSSDYDDITRRQILEFCDSSNLEIMNDGTPTRFVAPNIRKSAPDITICSPDIAQLTSWKVCDDTLGSDHFPITLDITFPHHLNETINPNHGNNSHINKTILLSICNSPNDYKHIFTDASKSSSGSGCGFYVVDDDFSAKFKLPYLFSIFSAEAMAIIQALQYIQFNNIQKAVIFSDSQSCSLRKHQ